LEQAIQSADEQQIELAVRRILMLNSIILSIGGIPLIYLGDEVGTLNEYSFAHDLDKADDSRWVHRPKADWAWRKRVENDPSSPHGHIFAELVRLIVLRKQQPAIYGNDTEFVETGNGHLFGYVRHGDECRSAAPVRAGLQLRPHHHQPNAHSSATVTAGTIPVRVAGGMPYCLRKTLV
jgi:glycosidase